MSHRTFMPSLPSRTLDRAALALVALVLILAQPALLTGKPAVDAPAVSASAPAALIGAAPAGE